MFCGQSTFDISSDLLMTRRHQLAALQTLEVPLDGANTADS